MNKKITEIVRNTLIKNNWGLYFKGQPLMEMPVNGEGSIYKLNDISTDELEGAISDEVKLIVEGINKEGEAECQEEMKSSEGRL